MKKKVLLSAYACAPNSGSEMGNGWNWAYHLAKLNYEVYCLTTKRGAKEINTFLEQNSLSNLHIIYVNLPELVNKFYWTPLIGAFTHYVLWQCKALIVARKLDKKVNVDVVHHVTWGSLKVGSFLFLLKKKMIFGPVGGGQYAPKLFKKYFMGHWREEIVRNILSNLFIKFNPVSRFVLRSSDYVLVSNLDTFHLAKKLGAKNVELQFDAALDSSFYPVSFPEREPNNKVLKILWVGRILPIKGLPLVLDVLSRLPDNFDYKLTIVGGGKLSHLVPKWIQHYGLSFEKVEYVGTVPFSVIKEYYASHDIFLFTTLRDSCPAQLLEAMAYGLPIITLNMHGGATLVPDNAGIKVSVENPEATVLELVEAVKILGGNDSLRLELGKNAYEFALKQQWELMVKATSDKLY